jgi:hypothetical protein
MPFRSDDSTTEEPPQDGRTVSRRGKLISRVRQTHRARRAGRGSWNVGTSWSGLLTVVGKPLFVSHRLGCRAPGRH